MFTIDKIQKLNDLELKIYSYIEENKDKVIHQKAKDVADALHVSSAMVTRVCKKLDCEGFAELKAMLRMEENTKQEDEQHQIGLLVDYFHKINNNASQKPIREATKIISQSYTVLFFGVGVSEPIAGYGTRLLNRKGLRSIHINDFSTRIEGVYGEESCAIILSVSGETKEVNRQILELRKNKVKVIVITNSENTTAAKFADVVISYYVPNKRNKYFHNSATQIPVIYILESIADNVSIYAECMDNKPEEGE